MPSLCRLIVNEWRNRIIPNWLLVACVAVMLAAVLQMTLCPPCRVCVGWRGGEVCAVCGDAPAPYPVPDAVSL